MRVMEVVLRRMGVVASVWAWAFSARETVRVRDGVHLIKWDQA
jgi:hypothetical protein